MASAFQFVGVLLQFLRCLQVLQRLLFLEETRIGVVWRRFEFFELLFVHLQALQLHLLLQEHIEVDPSQCGGEAGSVLQLLGSITLGPISGKRYFPVSNYY